MKSKKIVFHFIFCEKMTLFWTQLYFSEKCIFYFFNFWEKNKIFSQNYFFLKKTFLPEIIKCFSHNHFLRKIKDFWENFHFLPSTFQPLILKSGVRTHLHLEPGVLRTQTDITGCDQINTCDTEQHPQWTTMTLSRVHTSTITPSSPQSTWFLSSLLPEKKCR